MGATLKSISTQNCKQLLYFRIEYHLMITGPTNVIKVPLNTERLFMFFTSGGVIVSVQIHSRKKLLKGLEWPLQKWTSVQEHSTIHAILPARLNEKKRGCLLVWCGDALKAFQKGISEQYLNCIDEQCHGIPMI
jgi:hypothetical protein